jgi:hypothetical protein
MMNHLIILEVLPLCMEIIIMLLHFVALIILQRLPFAMTLVPKCLSSISAFATYSWEWFAMPAKQLQCTTYPRGDGQEYSLYADKPKTSPILLTCGIVNPVKEKYNGSTCVQVWMHEVKYMKGCVGDNHKGPLKNQGQPTYFRKTKNKTNLKHP